MNRWSRRLLAAGAVVWGVVSIGLSGTAFAQSSLSAPRPPFGSAAESLVEGMRLFEAGKLDAAREQFNRGLALARADHNVAAEGEAHRGLGLVLYQRAEYAAARAEQELALEQFRTVDDRIGVMKSERHLGSIARMEGSDAVARSQYEKALALARESSNDEEQAYALSALLFVISDNSGFAAVADEALTAVRRVRNAELEGSVLHVWGDRLFVVGDFAAAQQKYDEAAAILEKAGEQYELARVVTSLGRLYRAHGYIDRAMDCYKRALAIQEQIGDQQGVIQSTNALATAKEYQGHHGDALELYKQALALAEKTGSKRIINFQRGNLAGCYLVLGEYARARDLLETVLQDETSRSNVAYRYGQLSDAYYHLKDYRKALDSAERAVAVDREHGNLEHLPASLRSVANAHEALGQLDAAIADARELLSSIEQLRAKVPPSDFMKRGFGDWWMVAYAFAVRLYHEAGDPAHALEVGEAARARAFVDLLATREIQGKPSDRDRLADLRRIETEIAAVGAGSSDSGNVADQLTYRGDRRSAGASLREWRSADPELRSLVAAEPISIDRIVATAARLGSTMLSYWVSDDRIVIGVVRADGVVKTVAVKVSEQHLSALIKAIQPRTRGARGVEEERTAATPTRTGTREARRELYRLLIEPVADALPKEQGALLTIIPHGPLFLVSFAALVDGRNQYLLERFTIHYAPSAAVLEFTARKKRTVEDASYLLVADPADLPSLADGQPLPPLAGARREVAAIGRSLPAAQITVLIGAGARERDVRAAMTDKTIVHFATHGVVRDDDPFESFLALGRGGSEPGADGRLTAQEIYDLDLHADLVVLSACRTATGRVTGDGIIGLTRAFFYAGTPSVMATLWDVADEPGTLLLPRMYKAMAGGAGKAAALREAQLKLLAELRAGTAQVDGPFGRITLPEDPLFWAAFVVVGEP